ncbi:hypothetical protein VTL71DRAFT_10029 [Oculimacula yallundae]|uniref:Uncharacterized protein n=1 Tax=Oculimacula yallundae TaxID=86028 RepID=A0ABR4BQ50_9HELO
MSSDTLWHTRLHPPIHHQNPHRNDHYLDKTTICIGIDIFLLLTQFRPDVQTANFTLTTIVSVSDQQKPNTASLLTMKTAKEIPTQKVSSASHSLVPWKSTIREEVHQLDEVLQLISTNYGDDMQSVPESFTVAVLETSSKFFTTHQEEALPPSQPKAFTTPRSGTARSYHWLERANQDDSVHPLQEHQLSLPAQ